MLQILPLLLACPAPFLQEDPAALRVQDLQAHIGFLASDELEGRESGKRGGFQAARYVARQFERLGLQPLGRDGSYLLPFEVRKLRCQNVAGLLPGTEPALADRILVVGGHHDHAGIGGPGAMGGNQIHNGADDNASGTAGVLELAEWFAAHPPRHPILFVTFDAEERGLLGSKAFVKEGPVPPERILAMMNMDMIGRSADGYLFVGGLGTAAEFHELLDPVLEDAPLELEISDLGDAPSDNSSFHEAGIPALFLFTNIHEDYHLPSDDVERINFPGEVAILKLAREMLLALDRHDGDLTFHRQPGMALPRDFMERNQEHFRHIAEQTRRRGRLGLHIDGPRDGGLAVASIREDSAAAAAGIQPGDVILAVDGREVASTADLRRALAGREKGEEVLLLLLRDGRRLELRVTLH